MFELSAGVIEDLIFAMEDQDLSWQVDLATGELRSLDSSTEEDAEGLELASPPQWTSREGFAVMESFMARVRHPSARSELQDALQRGRGVFKAFKEALAAWPELEKAFREHKHREMGRVVRAWYDDLRERSGLERLPPEPEEEEDLVRSDFAIEEGGKAEALSRMLALLEGAEEEARAELPPALASFEAARLRDVLSREEWIGAWIDDGEGGAIAGAAARIEGDAGQSFIRLFFLHVVPDFRRSGIGEALVEQLSGGAGASRLMVIDAPFLPPGLAAPLAARGFLPWGLRLRRRL